MFPKLKLENCLVIILGSVIQAVGIYNIHALSNVTEGGVLGLTLLIRHWLKVSPAVSSLILNALCFGMGWKVLGRSFIGYSVLSILSYSGAYGILECFPPLWPEIAGMPLAAALAGGVFIGIGAGLCVCAGGATSGDDALAMSINHLTGIPVERIYLVSDMTVLLLSLSYIPLGRIVWSLLTVILSGQIIGIMQKTKLKARLG